MKSVPFSNNVSQKNRYFDAQKTVTESEEPWEFCEMCRFIDLGPISNEVQNVEGKRVLPDPFVVPTVWIRITGADLEVLK